MEHLKSHFEIQEPVAQADLTGTGNEIVKRLMASEASVVVLPLKRSQTVLTGMNRPPQGSEHLGLFSSGTTGAPKCVWLKREAIAWNARMSAAHFQVSKGNRMLILASPWHMAGLSWAWMAESVGAHYEIVPPYASVLPEMAERLKRRHDDFLFCTPSALRNLMGFGEWNVGEIVAGGAPFEASDLPLLKRHADWVTLAYGQTEAGGLISSNRLAANEWNDERLACCVGRPPDSVRLRCYGSVTKPGPVYVHSPSCIVEGWHDTGDRGHQDELGQLYLFGREAEIRHLGESK